MGKVTVYMLLNRTRQYLLYTILLLSLVFNQGLGMLNSAYAMSSMQSFSDDDTLVICTGKSVKWISALEYYTSGNIVEVGAPQNTPDNLHDGVSCIFAQLNDTAKDDKFSALQAHTPLLVTQRVVVRKRLFISGDYLYNFNARAPPTSL